jgi:hypothetical protein
MPALQVEAKLPVGGSLPPFFPLSITSTQAYVKGNTVDVYIDPNNPVDYSLESLQSDKLAGWICIGMSYLMRWLSQRYKFFAAVICFKNLEIFPKMLGLK